jgi:hypothetical protein
MATEPTKIASGWNAFVKDGKICLGIKHFPAAGKYFGKLTLINKPTEVELKAELTRLKISLPTK